MKSSRLQQNSVHAAGFFRRVVDFTQPLSIGLLMTLAVVVIYDVFTRYVMNSPSIFASEFSRMLQVTLATLGAAYVLEKEGHVTVNILLLRLNTRWRTLIGGITSVISGFFCFILVWLLWDLTSASYRTGERTLDIGWFLWPVKLIATLGILLLGLQFISRAYKKISAAKGLKKG
jgi:TRAP-type C4-dicarboxylate transport system permease small subunit